MLAAEANHADSLPRNHRSLLTAELLREAEASDPEERRELIDQVVRLNMPLARSIASRYFNRGVEADDLVQVAYLALTRAAQNFDTSHDRDFLSYALPTVRGELKKHFRDHGWSVRPPRRVQVNQARITRAEAELHQQIGRSPTPTQIAAHLDLELGEVIEALAADGCFTPTSLDRPMGGIEGDAGAALVDFLGGEDPERPAAEARLTLAPVVRRLDERDRQILYMRFFEEKTQQDIGRELGVTQMQISRILSRIMRTLRQELEAQPHVPVAS